MADEERRERRPSIGAPVSELQGPIGPGFSRPKHKRTFTGFGPAEIKSVEASIPEPLREACVQLDLPIDFCSCSVEIYPDVS